MADRGRAFDAWREEYSAYDDAIRASENGTPLPLSYTETDIQQAFVDGYRRALRDSFEWRPLASVEPGPSGRYLVIVLGIEQVQTAVFTATVGFSKPNVTHWLPLPEAPNG